MVGIIFDFNGTLYDDDAIQKASWERMSEKYRNRGITSAEMDEHVNGRYNKHTLEFLLGRQLSAAESTRYSDEKEELYRQLCLEDSANFHLRSGVPEYLDALKAAQIPFTIATASALDNVQFFFKAFNLAHWFDAKQVVYNDGSIKGKPNPDIFLRAATNINVPATRDIIFEDSDSGIAAAQAAHAGWTVGVETPHNRSTIRDDARLSTVIADYTDDNKFLSADFLKRL